MTTKEKADALVEQMVKIKKCEPYLGVLFAIYSLEEEVNILENNFELSDYINNLIQHKTELITQLKSRL